MFINPSFFYMANLGTFESKGEQYRREGREAKEANALRNKQARIARDKARGRGGVNPDDTRAVSVVRTKSQSITTYTGVPSSSSTFKLGLV